MKRFVAGLVIALIVAAVPLAASADAVIVGSGNTAEFGGHGGGDFYAPCPDQSLLIGVNVTVGKDVNSISPVCLRMENGIAQGDAFNLRTYGDADDEPGWVTCQSGWVLESMDIATSNANLIHHLQATCRKIDSGKIFVSVMRHSPTRQEPLVHSGESKSTDLANCGGGGFAIGIFGGYGAHVDRLGLICGKFADAATVRPPEQTQQQPAPTQPAKPIKHTARGGNDTTTPTNDGLDPTNGGAGGGGNTDNGGGGNGDGAGGATAAVDTTIYDQPAGNDVAYLSAGDPITIVSCNGDNWCKISAPRRGWVWGDDIAQ